MSQCSLLDGLYTYSNPVSALQPFLLGFPQQLHDGYAVLVVASFVPRLSVCLSVCLTEVPTGLSAAAKGLSLRW